MFKFRLDAVSDAVFGIVLTILVLEIKVPQIDSFSERDLQQALIELGPLFFAFALSFTMLITYWYSHNFLFSLLSKNVNRTLMNLNFLFLAFVSLVPFSSHLVGAYPQSQTAVMVYGGNIALIAILNWITRDYIYRSPDIGNPELSEINTSKMDVLYGSVRIWIALYGSLLAMVFSLVSTYISLGILLLQAVILIIPGLVKKFTFITGLHTLSLHPNWAPVTKDGEKKMLNKAS